jgi:hypothetical protein
MCSHRIQNLLLSSWDFCICFQIRTLFFSLVELAFIESHCYIPSNLFAGTSHVNFPTCLNMFSNKFIVLFPSQLFIKSDVLLMWFIIPSWIGLSIHVKKIIFTIAVRATLVHEPFQLMVVVLQNMLVLFRAFTFDDDIPQINSAFKSTC